MKSYPYVKKLSARDLAERPKAAEIRKVFRSPCVVFAVPALLALLSCGPSFQAIYEGNVRFEHCYAIDENSNVTKREKADCWYDWTRNYTYGQTRDRIEYAAARYYALSVLPKLDEANAANGNGEGVANGNGTNPPRKKVLAAPMPTSAHAPPPNTMPEADASAPSRTLEDAGAASGSRIPPGSDCSDDCNTSWEACKAGCKGKACEACDRTYRGCMVSCFQQPQPKRK